MSSPPGNADFRRALLESPFPGLFAINQGGSQTRNDNLSLLDADRTVQTFLERMRSLAQQSDGNLAQTEELILTAQHALATLEAVVSQVMKAETHFRLGQERLIFGFVIVASFLIVAMTILLFRRVQLDPSTAIVEEATRKLEENYNRATLGQISATIVHELAGPLTVISGQVFKIMKLTEDLSPENVEMKREQVHICAETAQDATQRMLRLSRSILSFAKTGRVTQMKPTPVSDILTGAALLIDATAKQFKVSVTIENLVSAESQVFADQSDIVQIVVNLVKNSAEAQVSQGEDPEIKVVVDLQESLNEVRFLVIDYGLGITEDLAEQIFKPFVTHGKGGKGNGIGLALCQQLADRNSSKLRIASARSPTVFELRVPTQSQRKEHVLPEDDRAA